MKKVNKNITDNLHFGGVVLVGIVNLPENINDSESGIAVLDYLLEPGSIRVIKNVDGKLHIFRVNSVHFAR